MDVRIDGLGRGSFAHEGTRPERTAITKNKFYFLPLLASTMLTLGFWAQPAFAHEPPEILPTQLDFDASPAPKKCNDEESFRRILGAWVGAELLREDAERRLVVRIASSAKGGKRADVSLVDAQGVVVAERHTPYLRTTECHKVLWEVAYHAATMLGAFEATPPKEPIACPTCPPIQPTPPRSLERRLPTFAPLRLPVPTIPLSPAPPRFFVGLGAFVGSGIFEKLNAGPRMLLGFVPFRRFTQIHLEWETSWTAQTFQSVRVQAVPLVGSACWVRGIVRFCGGVATTILVSNEISKYDSLHVMFGPNVLMGTEFFNHGPFSIRADVFGRVAIAERTFGLATTARQEAVPFNAGVALMAFAASD